MPGIRVSCVIDAPLENVWGMARGFDSVFEWLPSIREGFIEGDEPPTKVGVVRQTTNYEGSTFREKLLEHSDLTHSRRYTIVDGPVPVTNYLGRLGFSRITGGERTLADWSNSYEFTEDASREQREAMASGLTNSFRRGLENLDDILT